MMDAEQLASQSLSEQVADAIVAMIAEGRLVGGQRLGEAEFADCFHTSRVPIREALKVLETRGILAGTPHRGTHVMEFGAREQTQVIEARIAIERIATVQAAARVRADPLLLALLDQVLGAMSACVRSGERIALNRADVEFHRRVYLLSGNAILITLWGAISNHVLIGFGLSNDRYPNSADVLAQHRRLRETLVSAPLAAVGDAVEAHVLGRDIPTPEQAFGSRSRDPGSKGARKP